MFISRLVRSCITSLPIIKMGFGKLPMVTKCRAYPLWDTMMRSLRNPEWKQQTVSPHTITKRNTHTDQGDTPGFGYRHSAPHRIYDPNQEKFVDRHLARQSEEVTDEHQHRYTQKTHWRNLEEKIQQKAPLWHPKHHLKKGDDQADRKRKRKVAEVYLKKDAESFPLRKSEPFPKE